MAGKDKEKEETLTLDNLESALAKDNKVKLAGIDIDGMYLVNHQLLYSSLIGTRYPPWQAHLQEEVPLCGQGWFRLLQRHLWLGHA